MSEQRIDPPIPLPEFDPYEQLGKARQRIAELMAQRDAAVTLSRCGCGAEELCANLVKAHDRAEAAEAAYELERKACHDLTEKVIPNLREKIEAAEAEIADAVTNRQATILCLNDEFRRAEAAEAKLAAVGKLPDVTDEG